MVSTRAAQHTSAVPPSASSEGPASVVGQADGAAAPIYGIKLPPGYRDWKMISVAHAGGSLDDLRMKLGNDAAIKAYRQWTLPFPDDEAVHKTRSSCHEPAKERDFVLTRYAP